MKTKNPNSQRTNMHRAAFTLVEMLLVLMILAVLAAIVIPKFAGRSEQAKVTAAQGLTLGVGSWGFHLM